MKVFLIHLCILYTLLKVQFTLLYLFIFIEIVVQHAARKIVAAMIRELREMVDTVSSDECIKYYFMFILQSSRTAALECLQGIP